MTEPILIINEFQNVLMEMQSELIEFRRKNPNSPKIEAAQNRISRLLSVQKEFDHIWSRSMYFESKLARLELVLDETMNQLHEAKKEIAKLNKTLEADL